MWALDLGTTNSLLARWDPETGAPAIVKLPRLSRAPSAITSEHRADSAQQVPLFADRGVPSALEVIASPTLWARLGRVGWLSRLAPGALAHIGQPAIVRNAVRLHPGFVRSFKRDLMASPLRSVARLEDRVVSAREASYLFLRELFAEVDRVTGERPRSLVVTVPSVAYESYRAEVAALCKSLGVRRVRFIDEPVAAALGYGLGLGRPRRALVVDCGGGTMHVALVALSPAATTRGEAVVLAKAGRRIGGDTVDAWLAEWFARQGGYRLFESGLGGTGDAGDAGDAGGTGHGDEDTDQRAWRRLLVAEARRVKEAVYFQHEAVLEVTPPEQLRRNDARARGQAPTLRLTREGLAQTLETRGYLAELDACISEVLLQAGSGGHSGGTGAGGMGTGGMGTGGTRAGDAAGVDDVLMVGGSTLLPGVYPLLEARFGRDRVRAWQPFEAVALGACVFAADRVEPSDFIVNDYALLTHNRETQAAEYTVIVPRGTRFPTDPALWTRALVPSCGLGVPETVFKLVVCEVGAGEAERRFTWDAAGRLHAVGDASSAPRPPVVVALNTANPTLGRLEPPHAPSDSRPRLQVSFGVNADRWLCATVTDLLTQKPLMRDEPVVRLL